MYVIPISSLIRQARSFEEPKTNDVKFTREVHTPSTGDIAHCYEQNVDPAYSSATKELCCTRYEEMTPAWKQPTIGEQNSFTVIMYLVFMSQYFKVSQSEKMHHYMMVHSNVSPNDTVCLTMSQLFTDIN